MSINTESPISAISEQNKLPINKGKVVIHDHSKLLMCIRKCFVFEDFFLPKTVFLIPVEQNRLQNRQHYTPCSDLQSNVYIKKSFCI